MTRLLLSGSRHSVSIDVCSGSSAKAVEPDRMCKTSDVNFSKLRISRAYIKLLCIPKGLAKIVSLARIGNCEVRMLESLRSNSDATPLFSIELFDHDGQSLLDSCICYSLDEGAAAFQDFISR
jgi:hypothetical protein